MALSMTNLPCIPIYHLAPASNVGGGITLPFIQDQVAAQRALGLDARLVVTAPRLGLWVDRIRGRAPRVDAAWARPRLPSHACLAAYLPLPGRSTEQKLRAVLTALSNQPPGIIHGHLLHEEGWVAARAAATLRDAGQASWRSIATAHGSDVHNVLAGSPDPLSSESQDDIPAAQRVMDCCRAADQVVAVARALAASLEPVTNGVIPVLPVGGVDLHAFRPAADFPPPTSAPRIAFVARLTAAKGAHDLLTAFTALLRSWGKGTLPVLELIGPDSGQRSILEALLSPAARERTRFIGPLSHAGLARRLPGLSCLCLPSHGEGLPVVILEALACAIPVVASTVGDIPAVVHQRCGLLVPPGQPDRLATALRLALERRWDRTQIRNAAAPFDTVILAARWAEQYRELST